MPLIERDYMREPHPPSCNCADCCANRLGIPINKTQRGNVTPCPKCGKRSLWYNTKTKEYECLNLECKFSGRSIDDISKRSGHTGRTESSNQLADLSSSTGNQSKNSIKKRNDFEIQGWLIALLLIFALSIIGIAVSIAIGTFIPLWILIGFSCIFSIEKWFGYYTRKYHKWTGRFYRLFLNLAILASLGIIVRTGIVLFSQQFYSALTGSLLFIAEFAFFIWLWRVVSKNSWRRPSMKMTVFSIIGLFLIFSFAGVQPMSGYKDVALDKIQAAFASNNEAISQSSLSRTPLTPPATTPASIPGPVVTPVQISVQTSESDADQSISTRTGIYKNYYLGLVNSPDGNIGGNGCYDDEGEFIILINNKEAVNPTYAQLTDFLKKNKTDQFPYRYTSQATGFYFGTAENIVNLDRIQDIIDEVIQPYDPHVCADFAERLHNEAEKAGIRCAYVSLDMTGYSDPYNLGITSNAGHACNAFQTTDKGLIYIDATGWMEGMPHPKRSVSKVEVVEGEEYVPVALFPESGWRSRSESMGKVTGIFLTWDGKWNN